MSEHNVEPVRGLPEHPPAGEAILWQGAPCWRRLSPRLFHARTLSVYFAVVMAWSIASAVADGMAVGEAVLSALLLLPAALAAAALFALLGWLISRTTVYTITTRRLVVRAGVALPLSINIPFSVIEAANVKLFADGTGDLSVTPARGERVGYLLAWPHVRPWRFARPEPTLRSIPNAAAVAEMLAGALGQTLAPGEATARTLATPEPATSSPAAAHPPLVTAA